MFQNVWTNLATFRFFWKYVYFFNIVWTIPWPISGYFEKRGVFSKSFEKDPIPAAPPAARGSWGGGLLGAQGGGGLPRGAGGAAGMGSFSNYFEKAPRVFQNNLKLAKVTFPKYSEIESFFKKMHVIHLFKVSKTDSATKSQPPDCGIASVSSHEYVC